MAKSNVIPNEEGTTAFNFQDVKNHINILRDKLSPLNPLTDEDVVSMNKLSDGDKVFISDCLVEAPNATEFLPAYFDEASVRVNNTLNDELYVIEDQLFELYQHVRRNRMQAADIAYSGVSTFYGLIKSAANTNLPKAVSMFKRLQDFHKKKVDAAKARAKKIKADKAELLAFKAAEKAA
jgi:hypothetical protein